MACLKEYTAEKIRIIVKKSRFLESKGKLVKALAILEKILDCTMKQKFEMANKVINQIVSICNQLSEISSTQVPFLRKAESAITSFFSLTKRKKTLANERFLQLAMATFNNWAFFHKTRKNYQLALNYFAKAIGIVMNRELKDPDSYQLLAKTKLNLSILYMELHKYTDSIKTSDECLQILQEEYVMRAGGSGKKVNDMISTYVLAFYGIYLVHEALGNVKDMREALEKAVEIGETHLDSNNCVFSTVQNALFDLEQKNSGRISVDFQSNRRKSSILAAPELKRRISQLSLSVPSSDLRDFLNGPVKSPELLTTNSSNRYYSASELLKKIERIDKGNKLNFLSADDYFFKEISKVIDIKSDFKYLKPMKPGDTKKIIKQETSEKRIISELRLKKHYRNPAPQTSMPLLQDKINILKQKDEESSKKMEKQINAILHSFECKKLIKRICQKSKKIFPNQRKRYLGLFFNQNLYEKKKNEENYSKIGYGRSMSIGGKKRYLQNTKDEIEFLLDKVSAEIKVIANKKEDPNLIVLHVAKPSSLSKSALTVYENSAKQLSIIKSSIEKSMLSRRRLTQTSSGALISYKLLNLQV